MILEVNTKTKLVATATAAAMVLGLIIWEYYNGGVKSIHFFHNKNLPAVSNWWGLLSIPGITWITMSIIQHRKQKNHEDNVLSGLEIFRFSGSVLFGIILTILFKKEADLASSLFILPFVLALFTPLYKPEYYLGFILSMLYGFGGFLPAVIGLLLIAIYALEYCVIRKVFLKIRTRTCS